jgi:putative resolvase
MRVREWAEREGLNEQTVWKWCREGKMPVPVEKTQTGVWLVHGPKHDAPPEAPAHGRTVCYARVSSGDQRADLQRQADRLKAFAVSMGVKDPEVVCEVGSGMNDRRRRLIRLLADPAATAIIVEHRDRLARMNAGLVESALAAQGRRVVVVDDTESDDGPVRDMTEALTSFCARLCGRRAARHRAERALEAAGRDD